MTTIFFFGRLSDAAGASEVRVDVPVGIDTIGALRNWLGASDATLAAALAAPGVRAARDRAFCGFDDAIADAREIAFMSPLSGG